MPYWNRILTHWEHRQLNEPTPSEIKQLAAAVGVVTAKAGPQASRCGLRPTADGQIHGMSEGCRDVYERVRPCSAGWWACNASAHRRQLITRVSTLAMSAETIPSMR
jgi:hypothetical protein